MKTTLLSFSAFFLWSIAQAQLNLNHFGPGNSKTAVGVSADQIQIAQLQGGQNQTWNFSTLNQNGENYDLTYVVPNQEILNQFPGSTLALKITDAGEDVFFAFSQTPNGMVQTGLISSFEGQPSTIVFQDPKLYLPANLNFGSVTTDEFLSSMDLGSSGIDLKISSFGQVRTQVDGSGTLVLPNGQTLTDVTRIRMDENYTDTIRLEIPGFPSEPELVEGRTKTYSWYKNDGSGNPLLFSFVQDSTFSEGEWSVSLSAFYLVPNATTQAKPTWSNSALMPYPNPCEDELNIPVDQTKEKPIKITLTDIQGLTRLEHNLAGGTEISTGSTRLSLSHLEPGIYFATCIYQNQAPSKPVRILKK